MLVYRNVYHIYNWRGPLTVRNEESLMEKNTKIDREFADHCNPTTKVAGWLEKSLITSTDWGRTSIQRMLGPRITFIPKFPTRYHSPSKKKCQDFFQELSPKKTVERRESRLILSKVSHQNRPQEIDSKIRIGRNFEPNFTRPLESKESLHRQIMVEYHMMLPRETSLKISKSRVAIKKM